MVEVCAENNKTTNSGYLDSSPGLKIIGTLEWTVKLKVWEQHSEKFIYWTGWSDDGGGSNRMNDGRMLKMSLKEAPRLGNNLLFISIYL